MIRVELLVAAALSIGVARETQAAPRRARAAVEPCPTGQFDAQRLLKVLPLELAASEIALVQTSTAVELVLTIAAVDCGPASRHVALVALDAKSGLGATRNIRVDPGPSAERIIAVAIAELVRELEVKTATPAPTPAPIVPTSTVVARVEERREPIKPPVSPVSPPEPAFSLTLELGVDAFPGMASAQSSLLAGATFASWSFLRFRAGLAAAYGLERDVRGEIDLYALAPFLAAGAVTTLDPLELELGPRLAVGWVAASGRASSENFRGRRVDALLAELWLDVAVRWRLSPAFSAGARTSAGYVLSGLVAQANDVDITGVFGSALGFALSVTYRF